jgi:hypothetical protein
LQVDEDQQLSQPARVDLSQLLSADYRIRSITELSLTANRRMADMPTPRAWPAEAEPIDSSSSKYGDSKADASSKPYPRWGGALAVGNKCSKRSSSSTDHLHLRQQQRRSRNVSKVYNIWEHPGDAGTVVELYPMEIRTWLIEVDW